MTDGDDPLCPERHEAAAYAAEEGRQKAQFKWGIIKYGGIAVLLVAGGIFAWSMFTSKVAAVTEAMTPCFISSATDCGPWAHPRQWFGDDDEVEIVEAPKSVTRTDSVEGGGAVTYTMTETNLQIVEGCENTRGWYNPARYFSGECKD